MSDKERELAELLGQNHIYGFCCPKCGGSYFGTEGALSSVLIRYCSDQFETGCKWRGPPQNAPPNYKENLNAMRRVECELERRGFHLEYGWEMKKGVVWSISDSELMFLVATRSAEDRMNAAIKVLRANLPPGYTWEEVKANDEAVRRVLQKIKEEE